MFSMSRLGTGARVFYVVMLIVFAGLGIFAAFQGWWPYVVTSVLLGIMFAMTAPFVLGKGWQTPEPAPTRRPVVRKRR